VAYALAHPALGGDFRAHLRKVVAAGSRQGRPRQK